LRSEVSPPGIRALKGSYYEIGLQLGATLGSLEIPEADQGAVALAARSEAILAERYPPLLEKVEGLIDGGKLNARDFKAFFYVRDALPQFGCTNLAVLPSRTEDHSVFVGVNYDWYYYAEAWREKRNMAPEGAFASLRVTHHWAGSPDGINDQGLGVFLSVLPRQEATGPGLAWHLIIDILLDSCHNVRQGWDLVGSVPHLSAFNYLLADGSGHALVAEALPNGVTRRDPMNGVLIATNHLPGREGAEEELSPDDLRRQRRSLARYARASELLNGQGRQIGEETVRSLLREHQAPICRGNHDPDPDDTSFDNVFGTIWSLLVRPAKREMRVAWGHPCRSEYVQQGFD
jgi:predicted choloylglycine hydrolase